VRSEVHRLDFAKIARLERDLYGETFHHVAPGCDCDDCVDRRAKRDQMLQDQTRRGWEYARHA